MCGIGRSRPGVPAASVRTPIMPLSGSCPACGKRHKAPDRLAGRTVSCLNCGQSFPIPAADLEDAAATLLDEDEPAAPAPAEAEPEPVYRPADAPAPRPGRARAG